ncbi:DMT family transporter [Vibrio rarus]|uniref:DMT family transporter n=1 Tax=Vibrio rarus TaxID=413403 RepID=UPI0021C49391|nr:DMT family transporter [Vibrio rarus]
MTFLGEGAALGAALVWAIATWMYGQCSHRFSALQLNMIKGVVASVMMTTVLSILPAPSLHISQQHALILGVSGVIGIAVGDSAYFAALKRIGPNNTLLLESLAPPLSGLLALLFLGLGLSLFNWLGVLVTTIAVTAVVLQPSSRQNTLCKSGIAFGLLASVCQASGVVISHFALVAGDVNPLLGALIRLSIGVLCVVIFVSLTQAKPFSALFSSCKSMSNSDKCTLLAAIVVGTFLALWLQQVAVKYANPAIAQTLIATSPLFMLVIYKIKGQRISRRSIVGTLVAILGVAMLLLG